MEGLSNLVALLKRRAVDRPSAGFTFLAQGEAESANLTYAELDAQARALAALLRREVAPGERALLLYPPGLEFIAAFFGCLYAGVVAVPAYPPRLHDRTQVRLRAIARDAEPRAVLSTEAIRAAALDGQEPGGRLLASLPELRSVRWIATDAPGIGSEAVELPEPDADALAFLQYTSGSTATPKGVMVTHANLLHNERMIGAAFEQDQESVVVGWLPLYHDMGLIGNVLQPLSTGARCVLLPPVAFLQKPLRWLAAIDRYRGTTSGGPNFAYDLCVRRIGVEERQGLDLSSWRVAFNGAEPVRAATLDRFAEAFASCGFRRQAFYPCYGLAEATLFVAGGVRGAEPRVETVASAALERHEVLPAEAGSPEGRSFVGCGRTWSGQRVVIAHPEAGTECPPGRVGEIWVSGPSVAHGYWRRPETTERDFRAFLAGTGEGPFLRTGDLGFLADGELFVTGRSKDLIILRGRNHYPQDIELTVEQAHAALRSGCGAAFAVEVEGEERLVVIQEVERRMRDGLAEVAEQVRRAVAEEHEAQVYEVVLIRAGTLPKTSSGKVQRHACRAAYTAGELAVVGRSGAAAAPAAPRPALALSRGTLSALEPAERSGMLEAFLRERAAAVVGTSPDGIDPAQPLTGLGLDSLAAVELKGAVEAALELPLPLADLLQGAGTAALTESLLAALEDPASEPGGGPVAASAEAEVSPLSDGQRALWFLEQLAPESGHCNIVVAARASGLDGAAFQRALAGLTARHVALRASFPRQDDQPVQRIRGRAEEGLVDFAEENASAWEERRLAARLAEEGWRPFCLETGPVLRVRIFARQDGERVLLLAVHHMVADFWSMAVLARDLGALYRQETGGPVACFEPLALTPADVARWQEERLAGERGDRLWEYWREQLAGAAGPVEDLDLPTDRPRPPVQTYRGVARAAVLPAGLAEGARALGVARGATLYTTLLAVFAAQLGRITGQERFAVGSPTSGRSTPGLAGLVGYFVNPVALRADLAGAPSLAGLLDRTRQSVLGGLEHGDFPFARLTEKLRPVRDPARSPLFQTMLVLHRERSQDGPGLAAFALGEAGARLSLGGLELESLRLAETRAQLDLTLRVAELADGRLGAVLEANADLFDADTVQRMLGHFQTLLDRAVAEPERSLAELSLLSEPERAQILVSWNATAEPVERELCLHELFEAQVARTPDAEALRHAGERLTYEELSRRANQLARHLRSLGLAPEERVGICLPRSTDLVVTLLAVLKAGGAYVPLDPAYPRERLELMLADSAARVLVTGDAMEEGLGAGGGCLVLRLDAERSALEAWDGGDLPRSAGPGHMAYVIYTSGSTGRPKGVAIEHRSAVALMHWARGVFSPEELAGVAATTSICFDLSVFELFTPLSWGGRVVLATNALDLPSLAADGVTLLNTVPSAMAELVRAGAIPASVRTVNLAGEPIPTALVQAIHALGTVERLYNLYGPSEDTTYSTFALLGPEGEAPIGRPVANTRAYLLDRSGEPVPAGIPGELFLGGEGLARGYLGRPELTAERFVPDPFAALHGEAGARLYRTGDLALWRPDGVLDFLGRIDHQVKVRGFRIELGEIEEALARHPAVQEAVVLACEERDAGRRLVACVVPRVGAPTALAGPLRAFLKERLPEYMVPTAWSLLETLPLNPNGKVDRRALARLASLAEPAVAVPGMPGGRSGALEELVAGVVAEVLGIVGVGRDDDFFELGGHSLLAARVLSRLERLFGVALPVSALFQAPTVARLAARIAAEPEGAPTVPPVRPAPRDTPAPLSFAQSRLWFLDRLEPGSAAYNLPGAVRLAGPLDVQALACALAGIVRRHEALRTVVRVEAGEPVQAVQPAASPALPVVDLGGLPAARGVATAELLLREEAGRPFDLERGPLGRFLLLRLGAMEHLLSITLHHIVSDGWSLGILLRELAAALSGAELPVLPLQYADYAVWQREWMRGEVLEGQLAYWRERLADLPPLELPVDQPRAAQGGGQGATCSASLPAGIGEVLAPLARRHGVTLFMALLAAFQTLLARLTGASRVPVGTPVSGRSAELEAQIGFFVNTLVLDARLEDGTPFARLLGSVRELCLMAYAHQELPFERLVEELHPRRVPGRMPLVSAVFLLEEPLPRLTAGGLTIEPRRIENATAKLELLLGVMPPGAPGEPFVSTLEYEAGLFEPATAARLLGHWAALLAGIVADPEAPCGELPLLSEAEVGQLLREWSGTAAVPYPREATIPELFAAEAARRPQAVALETELESFTYGELEQRANRLAHHLRRLGVGLDDRVALLAERSPELIVGLLGILKAGGAYLPLDPAHPTARLAELLADAAPSALVAQDALLDRLPAGLDLPVVAFGRDAAALARESGDAPRSVALPESAAYVMHTSGSTGRPKGVLVPHRAVVRLVRSGDGFARFAEDEVFLHLAPAAFDAATLEIWGALLSGARLALFPPVRPTLAGLGEALERHRVTTLWLTAGLFHHAVESRPDILAPLSRLLAGGDVLSPPHVARALAALRPGATLVNGYGPTENTTFTCCHVLTASCEAEGAVPIGRPIANTSVFLLDPHLRPVPAGVAGELCTGGDGLARGYLGRPELTAERFVPSPVGDGERLYRTGDLARFRRDGTLEFLGRIDRQVKVRGFRVEPGEIEAALALHPAVLSAAVVAQHRPETGLALAAFVILDPRGGIPAGAVSGLLRSFLAERLPEPLVPSFVAALPELPLNANGKVDRRALRELDLSAALPRGTFAAPQTQTEELLAGLWESVLGLAGRGERCGRHDDFFALGGHSLLATKLMARVRETFGVDLPLLHLFEAPTVARLAPVLERALEGRADQEEPPLVCAGAGEPAPLSFAQERFWFSAQLEPDNPVYNILVALRLAGTLRVPALAGALAEVVRRHEALRTAFAADGEGSLQWAMPASTELPVVSLEGLPAAEAGREERRLALEQRDRVFDLAAGELLRTLLLCRSEREHLLLVTTHHIAFDGSHELFVRELAGAYASLVGGTPIHLPELPVQYADFARWERRRLTGAFLEEQLAYWRERLGGAQPVLELPLDRRRAAVRGTAGASFGYEVGAGLEAALRVLAQRQGCTLFMVLLAGFQAVLHRYSGQEAISVGAPIVNRTRPELEKLIGSFVNTLVLRTAVDGGLAGDLLLERVRETALGAYAHRSLPFEMLVREVQPERDLSHTPLFQTMLSLVDVSLQREDLGMPGVEVSFAFFESTRARFDLLTSLWEGLEGGLAGAIEYDSDLFDRVTIQRLVGHFRTLLGGLAADPQRRVAELPLLGPGELHQVVVEWNDTQCGYDRGICLQELFEASAARTPEAVAVVSAEGAMSYGELERRANRLAHRLIALGAGPDAPVGVFLDRSAAMVVALLGVLKAGAAYVPLQTSHPEARLRAILASMGVRHAVTQTSRSPRLEGWEGAPEHLVRLDVEEELAGCPATAPALRAGPEDLAYAIFTSGSTGVPKGVMVRHRPVVNLIEWVSRTFGIGPDDRALFLTSLGFDLSVYDVFGLLAAGGSLRVASEDELAEPHRLLEILCREPITFWNSAPAALQQLVPGFAEAATAESRLRLVFLSGDWIPVALPDEVRRAFPRAAVVSLGGATEAAVWSNVYPIGAVDPAWTSIPYGRPIQNARYYVLDRDLEPCPIGVAGDLYIAGDCLSDGYSRQPEVTAASYLPDALGVEAGGRAYRTGDRAVFRTDGVLEFLGRVDHQVKVRGYRIELGEIEAALSQHPQVREVVVLARPAQGGQKRLVAYVVAEQPVGAELLRETARARLPEYMVPSAFVELAALPLTPNGKVDRRALPEPETAAAGSAAGIAQPRTPVEELLAGLWAELLGIEQVGIDSDFFELGGHSLLATHLVSRIRSLLHVELPLRDLFEASTVAGLARRIESARRGEAAPIERLPRSGDLPLSFAQQRLWLLDQLDPGSVTYIIPAVLRLAGPLDVAALRAGLCEIVRRHETLRATFAAVDGRPVQTVAPWAAVTAPVVDLAGCPADRREEELRRLAAADVRRPFDLADGPLLRVTLVRLGLAEHALLLSMHHIVSDGASVEVLIRELTALYGAARDGAPSPLPELAIQYADFAAWQQQRLEETGPRQLAYWRESLEGAPRVLELPADRPRGQVRSFRGAARSRALAPHLPAALRALCTSGRTTLFMTLLAAFKALLLRITAESDLLVGVPSTHRNRAETEGLIGLFVNTLVLRSAARREMPFRELLEQVRETALAAYSQQDLPFERIVEELRVERDLGHHPLFQVMFTLQPDPQRLLSVPGLRLTLEEIEVVAAKVDLSLVITETAAGGLSASLEYRTDLFEAPTVQRLLGHFATLLAGVVEEPERALGSLPLLAPAERHHLLAEWSDTAVAGAPGVPVVRLFEERAAGSPDAPALLCDEERLSYGELNRRANRLAHRLRRLGVGPEVRVGLCLERSAEMVVAFLAILKAGGAYVPVDPAYPEARIAFLLADSGISLLVSERRLADRSGWSGALLCLEEERTAVAAESADDPMPIAQRESLAYMIYTSGSTGRPKAVLVEHGHLADVLRAGQRELAWGPEDVMPCVAPFSFDIFLFELLSPLLAGGTSILLSKQQVLDPRGLLTVLEGATRFHAVPALMREVVSAAREEGVSGGRFARLRTLFTGGDRVPPDLLADLDGVFPQARVRILYGPTEGTVICASYPVPSGGAVTRAMIGRPLPGAVLRLCDAGGEPVPIGVAGEIWIGGSGVSRGYWNREALTAERFVLQDGQRFYRTGDLARSLPDGNLEFLGRVDREVKVRGFRIDLGEIEAALREHPAVDDAVVLALPYAAGDRRLVAYVAAGRTTTPEPEALRTFLGERLPEFMVPALYVRLDTLPLTHNGKVDRSALPDPGQERPETGAGFVAPRTPLERALAEIWAEVLGIARVGAEDGFFELGGHSLLATQAVSRIRRALGVEIPLRTLFEAPTVARLAAAIEASGIAAAPGLPPVGRRPRGAATPLSFAQQRLWFLDQLEPGGSVYNVPGFFRLRGELDAAALEHALAEIVRRHEVLRTTFRAVDGQPFQVSAPAFSWRLAEVDLTGLPEESRAAETRRLAAGEARRPFDLAHGPLLRTVLLRLGDHESALLVVAHHIVSDGWSVSVLLRELTVLYAAFTAGRPSPLPDLPIQYADFAHWQREVLPAEVLEAQLAAWRERLAGLGVLDLSTDRPRPAVASHRGALRRRPLPAVLAASLAQLAASEGATLFMVLLAAFQALLHRITGQSDLAVGSPVAGRNRAEVESLIGFFVNTLVLRSAVAGEDGFADLLRRVRATALDAFQLQDVPFERLVDELRPERRLETSPLFQVLFALQNAPRALPSLPDLELTPAELETGAAKFDLGLTLSEGPAGLTAELEFRSDLFDGSTIDRLLGHFQHLLEAVAAGTSRQIAELPLLSPGEAHQLLVEWNATQATVTPERTIHELFEEQAARTPGTVALIAGRRRLTYRELDERAGALARRLRALGVGPEERVGICADRTPEMIVGLLAILKAGGVYVPLDPTYPAERLAFTLADARVVAVLAQEASERLLPEHGAATIRLDEDAPVVAGPAVRGEATPDNLAYLIYTSGSTGRPKGVAITHRSAAVLLRWASEAFAPEELAGVLASTSICFDLSVFELFLPLAVGGAVILAANALELPTLPAAAEVTLINTVPSAIAELVREGGLPPGVRTVNLAGEPLKHSLVQRIYASSPEVRRVLNLYGPSEDTTYSTFAAIAADDPRAPSIGRPVSGSRAYVLDAGLRPVPTGVSGELFLAGAGLARGYFDRPDLTAEQFVPDPFAASDGAAPGGRLYRTGDLARFRPDGSLEFLGRRDHQVKVRGFRIELGEIELALVRHPEIREAVVIPRPDPAGDHRLVAYVVPVGADAPATAGLRAFLAASLPGFMVPAVFTALSALPLTPSGKIDRRALPEPAADRVTVEREGEPRTPLEEILAGIWSRILGVDRVGMEESFFDLGGHSLLAAQLISRVRSAFSVDLPLRALFERPTVLGLAAAIAAELSGAPGDQAPPLAPAERGGGAPLSFAQQRLWFLYQLEPDSPAYNIPAALLLTGRLDVRSLAGSFAEAVRRHEALRTVFRPDGPSAIQVILPPPPAALPVVDLGGLPAAWRQAETMRLASAEAQRPFVLEREELLRTTLLRLDAAEHVVLITMHHIVSDGWSMGVLTRDVTALYRSLSSGEPAALPPLHLQYGDFACWQRSWLQGEALERQVAYWRSNLAGAPPALALPTDFPRPVVQSFRGASEYSILTPSLAAGFKALCRREGATLFMGLLAGFQALLHLQTGQDDILVGSPVANRDREEIEDLVGFFVNTLVFRTDLAGRPGFRDLLGRVREATLGAYAHRELPFERLVEELEPQRVPGRNPIFQVLLDVLTFPPRRTELPELAVEDYPVPAPWSKFDLTLFVHEVDDTLGLRMDYNADLFRAATVRRMLDDLEALLTEVVAAPERPIGTLLGLRDELDAEMVAGFGAELDEI